VEALARLSKSLDDRPHDARLAQAYAEILLASGNATPEALRAAGRRTLLFGSDQAAQLLYGRILLETGSPQSAIDPLTRAKARFGPEGARATYYLARAEADTNRSDDALLHLKEAIELGGFSELQDARDRLRALEIQAP
jgi:predicted Zn-dependent protease